MEFIVMEHITNLATGRVEVSAMNIRDTLDEAAKALRDDIASEASDPEESRRFWEGFERFLYITAEWPAQFSIMRRFSLKTA